MNTEQDQPETLAAILLEMRKAGRSDEHADGPLIEDYADRIEAAAAREREAYCDLCKEKDATIDRLLVERDKAIEEYAPGNAAAMRDALERIVNLAPEYPAHGVDWNALAAEAFLTASSALSAPARNCDRFTTEDEAREAYWAYLEPLEFNDKPFVAITEWLFATAEGGEK